jgi:hypothetical protein
VRALTAFRQKAQSLTGRRQIDDATRALLVGMADAIRTDMKSLLRQI